MKEADPLGERSEAPCDFGFPLYFSFGSSCSFPRQLEEEEEEESNWTLCGSGVTKPISLDDYHLRVDVPSDYPQRTTSGREGGGVYYQP